MKENRNDKTLRPILRRWDSTAIILAIVIGVGIFRVPAEITNRRSSPSLIIFAWLAGGTICLLGAFCYGELASTFPQTGGNYVYLNKSYGRPLAFLYAWPELLVIHPDSIAAVSFIGAEHIVSFYALIF